MNLTKLLGASSGVLFLLVVFLFQYAVSLQEDNASLKAQFKISKGNVHACVRSKEVTKRLNRQSDDALIDLMRQNGWLNE